MFMLKRDQSERMAEIVKTEGVLGGKARIDGRRVSIFGIAEMVIDYDHSPEEVAHELDISLSKGIRGAFILLRQPRREGGDP